MTTPLYGEHDYPYFDWLESIGFTRDRSVLDVVRAWKRTAKGMVRVEFHALAMYKLRVEGPDEVKRATTKAEFQKAVA